jgi:hypothetical protein
VGSLFFLRFITPCIIDTAQWSSSDYGLAAERMALAKAVQLTTNALASHKGYEERKPSVSEEDFARLLVMHAKFERFAMEMVGEPKNTTPVSSSPSWTAALQQKRDIDSVLLYVSHHRETLAADLASCPTGLKVLQDLLRERECVHSTSVETLCSQKLT